MICWVCDHLFTHCVCSFPLLALSFFSSFLSYCSFGTDFNSPSDQFGIHKPLSTLLETLSPRDDEALQGMMITAAHHFLLQYVMMSAVTAHEQGG